MLQSIKKTLQSYIGIIGVFYFTFFCLFVDRGFRCSDVLRFGFLLQGYISKLRQFFSYSGLAEERVSHVTTADFLVVHLIIMNKMGRLCENSANSLL